MRRIFGITLIILLGLGVGTGLTDPPAESKEVLPLPAAVLPVPPPPPSARLEGAPSSSVPWGLNPCREASECRFYAGEEVLVWWFSKSPIATALVTSAPAASKAKTPAAIGNSDTVVIFGDEIVPTQAHVGSRTTAGYWFDADRTVAVEGNYFFLMNHGVTGRAFSPGTATSPFLAVPIIVNGAPTLDYLARPGLAAGSATRTIDDRLQGAEVNAVYNLYDYGDYHVHDPDGLRIEGLAGFRWLDFHESLGFGTTTLNGPAARPAGGFADTFDEFDARDNFYGGQLGLRFRCQGDKWDLSATGKCALGVTDNVVAVSGSTFSNLANGALVSTARTTAGGIFAEPSNIGTHSHDVFAIVPEAIAELGYLVTARTRVFVGYDFLYSSALARPGHQLDPVINPTQNPVLSTGVLTGPARPTLHVHDSNFTTMGINVGLEVRF